MSKNEQVAHDLTIAIIQSMLIKGELIFDVDRLEYSYDLLIGAYGEFYGDLLKHIEKS